MSRKVGVTRMMLQDCLTAFTKSDPAVFVLTAGLGPSNGDTGGVDIDSFPDARTILLFYKVQFATFPYHLLAHLFDGT